VFSEHGLASFAGAEDIAGGLRRALALGARFAAVTQGERGVYWIEAGEPSGLRHFPAFVVRVVDTLAAGDVFHGAFALELARGEAPENALRFAAAAAAIKCTRPGGRGGSPTRDEVERFLREAGER
jgi:sulfofructose kinase